jgi:hypothetical protein
VSEAISITFTVTGALFMAAGFYLSHHVGEELERCRKHLIDASKLREEAAMLLLEVTARAASTGKP